MSPDDWRALYDARIVAVRAGESMELDIEVSRLNLRTTLRLADVVRFDWRPSGHTWEDEDITDPAAIADARLTVDHARWSRDGARVVLVVSDGTIASSYSNASMKPLDDRWLAYWETWSQSFDEDVHPLVREWLLTGVASDRNVLLEAWRDARTSDLAEAIDVMDGLDSTRPPVRLDSLSAFDAWLGSVEAHPVASLRELARCATSTFDIWDDRETTASWWTRLTSALGAVDAMPDPRIGHALLASLYSPSDWWFRVDQVAHVAGPFEPEHDDPSFADHLLRLLDRHADAQTPARALQVRDVVLRECDCNGAEMGERLRLHAERIGARYPTDRALTRDAREALRWRVSRT